ncbi:MAG: hypothetical protein A3C93_05485 [Candidatus Lloydbacteria bacterium RIFCSPHIGHO2_02_FULL_54_17]|uniref:Uncharacterized protein n=1 Tax=Candidatus Lloydbacteria bacterium RIFCSPHIGHO2_02_FULL_54_17 TaxID=1798664 RepID=A0A1G2DAH0_9BACT|nr:MAG: hypothetical protein A2762_02905 [Candidatus Lloydbacteria bacterium RIFCSPHIGHO2_01_FULL_54_11]OGZ10533.1 MAG: hypothetical protein A3C93_05485 [Candidatus Lloydbacteria bacterium RIFCSPHIGHO2_02_FULL_54_17]OGZ15524.1 MAG: hypothetical protein A2948_04670 [Candidatus Lloydbacteria bacterium RIFCSPLOWO2_01_FULL_54_18]OGZ16895.1 MAG: hypothetical protein A3H76_05225 [Candidatus Lloydbacteria bacterium RIFCSPLOWO2_02_FULL_54_12]
MRFIIVLCTMLFAAVSALGEEQQLRISTHTDVLVKWTPKNWGEREKQFSLPGTYAKCGNYLFTFLPKHASNSTALLGFGVANAKGGIDSVVAVDARDRRVRIWEAPDGVPPSVKSFSDDPKRDHTGHILVLPKREYALVRECLGAKKVDPSKKPPKMISV